MPHIEIGAEKVFSVFGLPVTNTLLLSWAVVLLIVIVIQIMSRKMSLVPTGFQNAVEYVIEVLLGLMTSTFGSEHKAVKYLPYVATFFIMIVISNWAGVLPGVGSIGLKVAAEGGGTFLLPFLRSPASDLNFTLALAIVSIVAINIFGVAAVGIGPHLKRFFDFSSPINFFVGLLEIIGEFAKLISLAFRLFGNVFAGEVLLIIIGFLAPFIAPVPFLMLELFVGVIQALIFATLTLVFLSIAVEKHHG
ncbi:MAG TPA: F0F1 ATP synthase subunit A [Candidatus Paceibacterota bacterium]|jgi:F-type H+-transporting ATPase subunit a|nr:F0F1 ATP synthase subunit A [Candidatus Paceibacterota bacterium]